MPDPDGPGTDSTPATPEDVDPASVRPAFSRDSMALRLPSSISLTDLSPRWAWGGATGAGVKVAVIDSGIERDHPHLENCIDVVGGVAINVDDDGEVTELYGDHADDIGHGTACAGIIHSFAPQASITSIKVVGRGLSGKAAAFLRAIGWAVERRFHVINLSLGTPKREWALPFYEICDEAYFAGSLVVTAANNVDRVSIPSLYASVLSVACNLAEKPFRFHYNPDPPTEFLARGINVDVAWRDHAYATVTGNSFAAPHMSGIAALVLSKHPELRPMHLKTVLWGTAANVLEAEPAVPAGRLSQVLRPRTVSVRASAALPSVLAR